MRGFFDEWFYLMGIAFFLTVFIAGFRPVYRAVSARVPIAGLRETLAA